jgi:taurine--2-oxoglutarate transaminase
VHVVPPCTISPEQVKEGVAVLDEVLSIADGYYTGP